MMMKTQMIVNKGKFLSCLLYYMLKEKSSTTSQSDEPFVNCFGEKFDDLKILYRTELVKDVNLDKSK